MVELINANKVMEKQKGHVSNLLEDSWFFGNNLLSTKPRSSTMMLMSHSTPSTSSNTNNEDTREDYLSSKTSNLLRSPSLPPCSGITDTRQEEEEEEEEEARMGDLIREAMPMSSHVRFRGKEDFNMEGNIRIGCSGVGRLTRRATIDSSVILWKKDGIEMDESSKGLASTKSSTMLLPPKYTCLKGRKHDTTNSKNRPHSKSELTMITSPSTTQTSSPKLDKIKAQKSLSNVEIDELQGFEDLFGPNQKGPKITQVSSTLQRKWSLDSNFDKHRPKFSWATDQKPKPDEDIKAQIKLWARNVASNARHATSNN